MINLKKISMILKDKEKRLAISICGFFFIGWFALLTYKYHHFGYYDWDLALYSQAMWNLSNGSTYTSLFGMNFLANHPQYIAFFIVPLFKLFPHPLTLVYLQVLSYVAAAFIIYLIARERIGKGRALWIMILFLVFPANIFAMLFEFHFETLAVGLLALSFFFYQKKRFPAFLIACFFSSITKENIPFLIMLFGVLPFFARDRNRWKWSLTPLALGAAVFFISIFIITPQLRHKMPSAYAHLGHYAHLGSSFGEIAQNALAQPSRITAMILTKRNLFYLQELFGPLLVPCLISPHITFIALPVLMQNFLSKTPQQHTIYFHYGATIVPILFIAAINSLRIIKKYYRPMLFRIFFLIIVILGALHATSYIPFYRAKMSDWRDPLDEARREMIDLVPGQAAIIGSFDFLDHLIWRESLYAFYHIWVGVNYFSGQKNYPDSDLVDYALIDFENRWIRSAVLEGPPQRAKNINKFFQIDDWSVLKAYNNILLLKKGAKEGRQLVEKRKKESFLNQRDIMANIEDRIFLIDVEAEDFQSEERLLPLAFDWYCGKEKPENILIIMSLEKEGTIIAIRQHHLGYAYYPVSLWEQGYEFKEHYWMGLDKELQPGAYELRGTFFNAHQKRRISVKGEDIRGTVKIADIIIE